MESRRNKNIVDYKKLAGLSEAWNHPGPRSEGGDERIISPPDKPKPENSSSHFWMEELNDGAYSMEVDEHGKPTKCELCGKMLSEYRHLKRHLQTVHKGLSEDYEERLATEVKLENPMWDVKSLYEFQYFNCPSCSYKSDYKQDFVNHTFNTHPESVDFFRKISDGSLDDIITPWNKIAQTYGDLFFELKAKKLGPNAQKHCYIMKWIQVNVFQKNTLTKIETECSERFSRYFTKQLRSLGKPGITIRILALMIKPAKSKLKRKIFIIFDRSIQDIEIDHNRDDQNSINGFQDMNDELIRCEICEKVFKNKIMLKNHFCIVHNNEGEIITCDICAKTLQTKIELKSHIKCEKGFHKGLRTNK